jgi:hypothetical protein
METLTGISITPVDISTDQTNKSKHVTGIFACRANLPESDEFISFELEFFEDTNGTLSVEYQPGIGCSEDLLPSFLCGPITFSTSQAPMFLAKFSEALHRDDDNNENGVTEEEKNEANLVEKKPIVNIDNPEMVAQSSVLDSESLLRVPADVRAGNCILDALVSPIPVPLPEPLPLSASINKSALNTSTNSASLLQVPSNSGMTSHILRRSRRRLSIRRLSGSNVTPDGFRHVPSSSLSRRLTAIGSATRNENEANNIIGVKSLSPLSPCSPASIMRSSISIQSGFNKNIIAASNDGNYTSENTMNV